MANMKPAEYGRMFFEYAKPVDGVTEWVTFEELEKHFGVSFHTTNGSWAQDDRGPLKSYILRKSIVGNKLVAIKLDGKKDITIEKRIRTDILKTIKSQRCRVVDVGGENIECDHKDGRYTSETYSKVENQNVDDFQPLLRNVNLSKRTHCNICQETSKRYDAKRLGYSAGWIDGDENYINTCYGCYWYDPKKFNKVISKDFIKEGG